MLQCCWQKVREDAADDCGLFDRMCKRRLSARFMVLERAREDYFIDCTKPYRVKQRVQQSAKSIKGRREDGETE